MNIGLNILIETHDKDQYFKKIYQRLMLLAYLPSTCLILYSFCDISSSCHRKSIALAASEIITTLEPPFPRFEAVPQDITSVLRQMCHTFS